MVIETLIVSLGAAVAEAVFSVWIKENPITSTITEVIQKKTEDLLLARRIEREFTSLGDKIASSLKPIFDNYYGESTKGKISYEAVIREINIAIKASQISAKLLTSLNHNPSLLREHILKSHNISDLTFSEAEKALYDRSINQVAQYIIDLSSNLPDFTRENFTQILQKLDGVFKKLEKILSEIESLHRVSVTNEERQNAEFEEDYRRAIIRELDKVNLFGIDVGHRIRKYDLTTAYISLEVFQDSDSSDSYANNSSKDVIHKGRNIPHNSFAPINSHKISVEDALVSKQRVSIIGEAGSGKTTLLQWLAVKCANSNFDENLKPFNNLLPFYIALRRFGGKLPQIEQFIDHMTGDIPSIKPDKWIHKILTTGRGLILIDGFDEVLLNKRDDVIDWVEKIIRQYPKARLILTSRPPAYKAGTFKSFDFSEFQLSPMEYSSIKLFVQYWHKAVLLKQEIEDERQIFKISTHLLEKLRTNIPLMRIATNPLLCAMICSLHYDRNMQLPEDRITLYEACISGLLDRRDQERDIPTDHRIRMRNQDKRSILDNLAYWALKNGYTSFQFDDALVHITSKLQNMPVITDGLTPSDVLNHLIERSGLLREPAQGTIDFIHRTFLEFMAARAATLENDWGLLETYAANDHWEQTIILSTGFANITQSSTLIGNILDQSERTHITPEKKYYLQLLAIACLENATEVTKEIQQRVADVVNKLIPPKSRALALYLASAGDIAVPFLGYSTQHTEDESSHCIYVLSKISTRLSVARLSEFLIDQRPLVSKAFNNALQGIPASLVLESGLAENILENIRNTITPVKAKINGNLLYAISEVNLETISSNFPSEIEKLKINEFSPSNCYIFSIFDSVHQLNIEGSLTENGHSIDFCLLKNMRLKSLALTNDQNGWPNLESIHCLEDIREFGVKIKGDHYPNLQFLSQMAQINKVTIFDPDYRFKLIHDLYAMKNLTHLHLGFYSMLDLKILDKLEKLEILEISYLSDDAPDTIYGIEELTQIKKVIIRINTRNSAFKRIARQLKDGLQWCDIEFRKRIAFPG